MLKRSISILVTLSVVGLLGCIPPRNGGDAVREARELNEEMGGQTFGGYTWVNWLQNMKTDPETGNPNLGVTRTWTHMHASAELAAGISQIVARIVEDNYDEVTLQGVSDVQGTLTTAAKQIVVQELKNTEVLWTDFGRHYYAMILGLKSDELLRVSKKAYNAMSKEPGKVIKKKLTPQQEREVRERAEERQRELDAYIQEFLGKPLPQR